MGNAPRVDIVAWIERLRRDKEAIERDIAVLEGMLADALAVAERRSLLSPEVAPLPVTGAILVAPPLRTPTPPPRRTVPRLSSAVERLSAERVKAFAQEIQGMTQIEAIIHVAARMDDFQNADMVKIIIESGLAKGKRSNVSSHIYRLIVDSGKFEKVGTGRFRLIDRSSQESIAGDMQGAFLAASHEDSTT